MAEFKENAVSEQSGLKVDDKIIEVEGRKIFSTYDLSYAFTNVKGGKIDMVVKRDGEKVELRDVKFDSSEENGISYLNVDFYVYGIRKTFGSYIKQTFSTAASYCAVVWWSLIDLISGKYGISAVSGPVGITAAIGSAAKQNLENLLPIMALITINLGIFNLLPIPALGRRQAAVYFNRNDFQKARAAKVRGDSSRRGLCAAYRLYAAYNRKGYLDADCRVTLNAGI